MGNLRFYIKFLLFVSSYTPLFILLMIRMSFDQNNNLLLIKNSTLDCFVLFMSLFLIVSNIILYLVIAQRKKANNPRTIKIDEKEELNYIYIEYLFTYIIPFIDFNYNSLVDQFSIIFLLGIVFFVFNKSNLIYVNLIVNIIGYNIYKIVDTDTNSYILLSKQEKLLNGEEIEINFINDNLIVQYGV